MILTSNAFSYHLEKLFYLTPNLNGSILGKDQIQELKKHAKAINIFAPQIYQLNSDGIMRGKVDKRLIIIANENHVKLMPLIANEGFSQKDFHRFLHSQKAQKRAIASMITLCKQYRFYGLQFDFEHINFQDKNEFTKFFQLAANRLHHNGFSISIAVVPHTSTIFHSDYDRWLFENWSGAYDYKKLGQSADFISVMTYDRHTSLTTPGPISPIEWVNKTIKALLKVVPAEKISLGIPDYSGYWKTGSVHSKSVSGMYVYRSKEAQISYSAVLSLLNTYNQALIWNNQWKSSYSLFDRHHRTEYLFVENAKSFRAKVALAKHYHLRGISVWKLGFEDPRIWQSK